MKKRSIVVCLIVAMFSFLLIGCKQKVKVENIYFSAPSEDGVVLLVGETYTPEVYFSPLYPSNQGFKIISGDDAIVDARNNKLTALTPGKTYIKVVSDENELIQDVMNVQVVAERTQLATPTIAYSAERQSFTISSSAQDGFVNGYTIDINGESIAIGNVQEYSLADYNKRLQSSTSTAGVSAYDRDLTVKVQATVPNYTSIFTNSNFSSSIKVNQASAPKSISVIGGKLKIEKSKAEYYNVYVNDALLVSTNKTTYDLSCVDTLLANSDVEISVCSVGQASDGFAKYNSIFVKQIVKCAANVNANMIDETIYWDKIDGVESYKLFLGASKTAIATTSNNYFNLKTLSDYDTMFEASSSNYLLTIQPVLSSESKNVILSSEQKTVVKFNRLASVTMTCANNVVSWAAINNAQNYQIKLIDGKNNVLLNKTTDNRTIDFSDDGFVSGETFTLFVTANFAKVGDVCYLSSTTANLTVEKMATSNAKIENNTLKIESLIDDQFLLEIYCGDNLILNRQITASLTGETDIELLKLGLGFDAGNYIAQLTRLGDGGTKIDSAKTAYPFVQLQKIETINLENNIVSVQIDGVNLNNNAQIKLNLCKGTEFDREIENNTNLTDLNLASGEYIIKLFVLGDGSKTISVCDQNGTPIVCATKSFVVLETPTISTQHELAQFVINEVENTSAYNVIENGNKQQVANPIFGFDLASGQTREFAVQALGDGTNYINSPISVPTTFTRIETPTLSFNNANNSLSSNLILGSVYVLTINGQDVGASYVFGETVSNLIEGVNNFSIVVKAQDDDNVIYIDSYPKQIEANKKSANSSITITGNKLNIVPEQDVDDLLLQLTISNEAKTVVFDETNFADINNLLNIKRVNGCFTVDLLDDLFNPILSDFNDKFNVKVRYLAEHNLNGDDLITTDYSSTVEIDFEAATDFEMTTRDGQNVCFNIQAAYTYADYALVVNDKYVLNLNQTAIVDNTNQNIKFDIEYVYDNIEELYDINKITIITLNKRTTFSNLLLSKIGDSIYIARATSAQLTSSKDNSVANANNSRIVTTLLNESSFARSIVITVYNNIADKADYSNLLIESSVDAINFSFNLDEYGTKLTSNKKIVAYVKTNSNTTYEINGETQTIYMFNSVASNILSFDIVDNATVTTDGTKLCFSLPQNADGVDIYKQTTDGQTKLNTNLITTSFDLGKNAGNMSIVVKTISATTGNYTNSSESQAIDIVKLSAPTVGTSGGVIAVTVDDTTKELLKNTSFDGDDLESLSGCVIRVKNENLDDAIYIDKDRGGFEIVDNEILINPSILLQYGVSSLVKENLTFDIVVKIKDTKLYLNSNKTSADFYGLFAPTNISMPAVDTPEKIGAQTITWSSAEAINTLPDGAQSLSGYVLKVVDQDGMVYYSSSNLVYAKYDENSSSYEITKYPQKISSTQCAFPYGYVNDDGQTVKFGPDKYFVSIMSASKSTLKEYNLCNSKFSEACTITLIDIPAFGVANGKLVWQKIEEANEYLLTITDVKDETITTTAITSNNEYEFEGLSTFTGSYSVTIRALTNLNNVLSSETSQPIIVHHLASCNSVSVDDGVMIFEANNYFTTAEITFHGSNGVTETITYNNLSYSDRMEAIRLSGVTSWADVSASQLSAVDTFCVDIDDNCMRKLEKGLYTISIKLIGNNVIDFGVINSVEKTEIDVNNFVKLAFDQEKESADTKTWIRVDERGIFTFDAPEEYTYGGLNYQFNTPVAGKDYSFFGNVMIFKLAININEAYYNMLAVDYYDFVANKSMLSADDYEILDSDGLYAAIKYNNYDVNNELNTIYLCVFKNNQINFNLDNLNYYSTAITFTNYINVATNLNSENEKGYYSISLVNGGVFTVNICLLGSDVTDVVVDGTTIKRGYLTSDMYVSNPFIRYTENILKTYISYTTAGSENNYVYSGDLIFQNKTKYNENNQMMDTPVYLLEISPILYYDGTSVESAPYLFYLYHDETTVQQIVNDNPVTNYTSKQFVEVGKLENNNSYLKFEFGKYFRPGNYSIKIRTLAGIGSDDLDSRYLLNSKIPTSGLSFNRISDTNLNVSNGKLTFDLAYVVNDMSKNYVTDYEFALYKGSDLNTAYTFNINSASDGVSIVNNVLTYVLPAELTVTNTTTNTNTELSIENGQEFNIKVRAVQTRNKDVGMLNADFVKLNSVDQLTTIEKSQGAINVGVKSGVIVWQIADKENYNGTIIRIELSDGRVIEETISKDFTSKTTINGVEYCYYSVSDNEYNCIDGVAKAKISAGEYSLKLLTKGKTDSSRNVEILNSNYSSEITINRLNKIQTSNIVSNNGVLTWSTDEQAHINKYVVTLIGNNNYTFTTTNTKIDIYSTADDNGNMVAVGNYSINIRAFGSDYINSLLSDSATGFTKLGVVSKIEEDGNDITWQAVENAQAYLITFNWTQDESEKSEELTVEATGELRCTAPAEMTGSYTITIQAIGLGVGKVFNGAIATFKGSSERPKPVAQVKFDEQDSLNLIVTLTDDFITNDIVRISFNFAKYSYDATGSVVGTAVADKIEIKNEAGCEYIKQIDGVTYCIYPLATAGVYSSISVEVVRKAGSLTSYATKCKDIDFNYFAYGDGSTESPYGIASATQLLYIASRADKCFEFAASIDMSNVDFAARLNKYGAVVADTFTGTINGNNYSIMGLSDVNVSNTSVSNFVGVSLFKNLNNATIKNINIAEIDDISTKITNSFAQKQTNVLQSSLISMQANNSTIANIRVSNLILAIDGSYSLQTSAYISALVAKATSTTFEDCVVNMQVEFNADYDVSAGKIYIGGLVAHATDCKIISSNSTNSTIVTFGITKTKVSKKFYAIGGVAGYFAGSTSVAEIDSATVTINQQTNIYVEHFGGVVGWAVNSNITSCTVQGNFKHTSLEASNIGGIVGQVQGGAVEECTIKLVFDLAISNSNKVYVGFVAGYVTSYNQTVATIANCKINQTFVNKTTFASNNKTIENMGIYGSSLATNYQPEGCEKID